jgi:hypothetical protein
VADDASDYGPSRSSKNATAKNRTSNAAYASTNCGIFVLGAHSGTTAQTDQNRCRNGTDCMHSYSFHFTASMLNIGLEKLRTLMELLGRMLARRRRTLVRGITAAHCTLGTNLGITNVILIVTLGRFVMVFGGCFVIECRLCMKTAGI